MATQPTKSIVAGRGGGKTVNIGDHLVKFVKEMPHSKGFLLLKTFGQAYTKSLPEILDRVEAYGYKEHKSNAEPGHYIVTKTPPPFFDQPYKVPRKYENTISFWNGTMMDILSFDRPDLSRGGSYDWGIIDEAALIDHETFSMTVRPLLRGNVKQWSHPLRFSLIIYTSRAWKASGKWVETTMKRLAAEDPKNYFYIEFSAEDNMAVLGKDYFKRMKSELSPIKYSVEILNEAITKVPDGFYNNLDEEIHAYDPEFNYEYQSDEKNPWTISEKDLYPSLPLDVSLDFNAKFTSATVWQDLRSKDINELRCLRNFYVKYDLAKNLIGLICDHYKDHPTKEVNIYGGADGHHAKDAISEYTYYQIVANEFRERGWSPNVLAEYGYSDVSHKLKYDIMNSVLNEVDAEIPRIRINNLYANETIISMMQTQAKGDFKKDKKSELDDNLKQEYATHLSDTVDNYVIPKVKQKHMQSGAGMPTMWTM